MFRSRSERPRGSQGRLSGDLNGDDQTGGSNAENCHHVLKGASYAGLDGFWVVGGNANGTNSEAQCGGGLFTSNRMTVINCVFHANHATSYGGALYTWYNSIAIANPIFVGNDAAHDGGAIGHGRCTAEILNCTLADNRAGQNGGAVFNDFPDTYVTLVNSILWHNQAGLIADAIYSSNTNGTLTLNTCLIEGGLAEVCMTNGALRRITVGDEEQQREIVLRTNEPRLSAGTLARLYRFRRQIELFCKALKQNLKSKSFVGTSENAVKRQRCGRTWL